MAYLIHILEHNENTEYEVLLVQVSLSAQDEVRFTASDVILLWESSN